MSILGRKRDTQDGERFRFRRMGEGGVQCRPRFLGAHDRLMQEGDECGWWVERKETPRVRYW
jgi:hypothetical protein